MGGRWEWEWKWMLKWCDGVQRRGQKGCKKGRRKMWKENRERRMELGSGGVGAR